VTPMSETENVCPDAYSCGYTGSIEGTGCSKNPSECLHYKFRHRAENKCFRIKGIKAYE
jgi:hypothetical protein